ncbi:MAG: VCBS repeat-containing protein [Euryarchaeota archaeon]|nr:VCBS repeat-containing protein [Euryarchaeota archaeon]
MMDGGTKKIIIVAIAAIVVISSIAVLAAIRKEMEKENPETVIQQSLNVKNPVSFLDKNHNQQPDYAEVSVNANENEARGLVYDDSNVPEPLSVAKSNSVNVPVNNSDGGETLTAEQSSGNASLIHAPRLRTMDFVRRVFFGFRGIHINMKNHSVSMNAENFISRAKYGIPEPDMAWMLNNSEIARHAFPGMFFGKNGFNATQLNFTSIKKVVRVDKNHDGNPEYFKLMEYSNLTQDLNGDGKPDAILIRYHELIYYDNNSDGNPNYEKWITVFAYLVDANHDGYYEKRVVLATGGYFVDNNSDGYPNFYKAYAIGNETVDMNENHHYEFHMVMLGGVVKYNNGTTTNWTSEKAFFGIRVLVDRNDSGVPQVDAASLTGYIMKDKNGDGHPEMEKFMHWRYLKVDKNGSGNDNLVKGMAAYAVYYDNNSNGNPEYQLIAVKGVVYRDVNQDGKAENGILGYACWKARDGNDDSHPESVLFRLGIVNGTDENENGIYERARKLYVAYTYYDNNSDGNPEYVHMLVAGWSIYNPNETKMYQHASVLWSVYTKRDNNSDGNPESVKTALFYREVWNPRKDGVYGAERGVAELGWKYDNNSNGVYEKGSLRAFGYKAYRNGTGKNITSLTLVVVRGNFTNVDDSGAREFENYTFMVVNKHTDGNVTTTRVWVVMHKQYLKFNETANQTWLYNETFRGVYTSIHNDTGKSWTLRGLYTVKIDYNLDGTWDYTKTVIVNKSGH